MGGGWPKSEKGGNRQYRERGGGLHKIGLAPFYQVCKETLKISHPPPIPGFSPISSKNFPSHPSQPFLKNLIPTLWRGRGRGRGNLDYVGDIYHMDLPILLKRSFNQIIDCSMPDHQLIFCTRKVKQTKFNKQNNVFLRSIKHLQSMCLLKNCKRSIS